MWRQLEPFSSYRVDKILWQTPEGKNNTHLPTLKGGDINIRILAQAGGGILLLVQILSALASPSKGVCVGRGRGGEYLEQNRFKNRHNWHARSNGGKKKARGPWWSFIAHLSKQLCILTVEVSAKFTALKFLYKFYNPAPQWPCFFHPSWWLELNSERGSPKEQFCCYIEIGRVVSDK